jgi:hypothetical protein
MVIPYHVDPGHAWGRVPRTKLVELGVENEISSYSYQRGPYVYLEEDCDLPHFVRALTATGVTPVFRLRNARVRSRIRQYASFQPTQAAIWA